MKYLLIIWVCAFLSEGTKCMNPIKYPVLYDSWYECSRAAHQESLKILSKGGYVYVNKYQLGTKYNCDPVQTY
jgi:hypothetical protein